MRRAEDVVVSAPQQYRARAAEILRHVAGDEGAVEVAVGLEVLDLQGLAGHPDGQPADKLRLEAVGDEIPRLGQGQVVEAVPLVEVRPLGTAELRAVGDVVDLADELAVREGIPAVIAMQFEVSERTAATLSREFYRSLADNYPVDAALAEARGDRAALSPVGPLFHLLVHRNRALHRTGCE